MPWDVLNIPFIRLQYTKFVESLIGSVAVWYHTHIGLRPGRPKSLQCSLHVSERPELRRVEVQGPQKFDPSRYRQGRRMGLDTFYHAHDSTFLIHRPIHKIVVIFKRNHNRPFPSEVFYFLV